MIAEVAIAYMERRSVELGYKSHYIRIKTFVLQPSSVTQVEGGLSLFLLLEASPYIRVESETGLFDLTETAANELQYEHQGTMRLTNYSAVTEYVQMIQLILKDERDADNNRKV